MRAFLRRLRRCAGKLSVGSLVPKRVRTVRFEVLERGDGQVVFAGARGGGGAGGVQPHEHVALGHAVFRQRQVPQRQPHLGVMHTRRHAQPKARVGSQKGKRGSR